MIPKSFSLRNWLAVDLLCRQAVRRGRTDLSDLGHDAFENSFETFKVCMRFEAPFIHIECAIHFDLQGVLAP